MPGDDQKTASSAKVTEGMSWAKKHVRYLRIYAGFDPEYSEAKWVGRRESEIRVPHPPSSLTEGSTPWAHEVDRPVSGNKRAELHDNPNDDTNEFDLNDQDELDNNITRFTDLAAISTQPITTMKSAT